MSEEQEDLKVIPVKIAELSRALGMETISNLTTAWEHQVDEKWKVAVNGQKETVTVDKLKIPPFHFAVWYNGWPAGLMSPFDGTFAAGSEANEDTFIAALDAAIERAKADNDNAIRDDQVLPGRNRHSD